MITVRHMKCRNGETLETASITMTQKDALNRYLLPELVRGGNVIEMEKSSVTTSAKYRGYVNKFIFTGSYGSMEELYKYASFWADASAKYKTKFLERVYLAEKFLVREDEVLEVPFVDLLAQSTIGNVRLRIAAMLATGITDAEDVEIGLTVPLDEFVLGIKRSKEGMEAFPSHVLAPR